MRNARAWRPALDPGQAGAELRALGGEGKLEPAAVNAVLAAAGDTGPRVRRAWPAGTHTGPLATPQGEVPPTGRTLQLPICLGFEVAAGRITSNHAYYDQMTLAAQLGLLPEPAPAN